MADDAAPLMHVDWLRWFETLKARVEALQGGPVPAETIIGVLAPANIPQLPFTRIDLTTAPRLLGRTTSGAGPAEEIRVAPGLVLTNGILSIMGLGNGYVIGDLLYADSDHSLARLADVAVGSYLRSGGVATAPLWSTLTLPNAATSGDILKASGANAYASVAPAALTKTDDTNVTLTLGGSASTALVNAASLTLGWTGLLGLARGGTNANLAATGGAGQVLKQASVGAAVTVGTIPAADIVSGAALTRVDDTNVTLTLGGSPTTALLAATSLTLGWSGTLALTRGGVGFNASGVVKGGLLAGTGAGTFGLTTVGANGTVLTADSSAAGGVAWSAAGSGTVTGSGTTGTLAKFTAAGAIGDSILTEAASVLSAAGDFLIRGATNNAPLGIKPATNVSQLWLEQSGSADGWKVFADNSTGDLAGYRRQSAVDTERWRFSAAGVLTTSSDIAAGGASILARLSAKPATNVAQLWLEQNNAADGWKVFVNSNDGSYNLYRRQSSSDTLYSLLSGAGAVKWPAYGAGAATFDASGNITSVSDSRFKDRIAALPYGLTEILALQPVQHGYNALSELDRDHLYGGFIAQDVQTIMPLAIGQDARGYLTLADRPILGAVVHAVQELHARLTALEQGH